MTVIGTVQNGKVVLPPGVALPDGTEVSVEVLKRATSVSPATPSTEDAEEKPIDDYALNRELLKFAGIVKGMPSDFSINHDHYLYGTPKTP